MSIGLISAPGSIYDYLWTRDSFMGLYLLYECHFPLSKLYSYLWEKGRRQGEGEILDFWYAKNYRTRDEECLKFQFFVDIGVEVQIYVSVYIQCTSRVHFKLGTFCLMWNLSIFTESPAPGMTRFKIVWSISDRF